MTSKLEPTIAKYFAATNDRDLDGVVVLFTDRAVVKDEGREHHGPAAIRSWMRDAIAAHDFVVEPIGVAERRDDSTVVAGVVSGNFPGSPATLRHRFIFDGEKIARLEIG
jgi:hypothetical protein